MARVEMMTSFLLLCFDRHRSGGIPLQSFKAGLVCLAAGWAEEKWRYLFSVFDTDNDGYAVSEPCRFVSVHVHEIE